MIKYNELFDHKKVSIFLIALPYFTFNFQKIYNSPFFSIIQLFFLFATILLLDFIIKILLSSLIGTLKNVLAMFVIFFSFTFFYGIYLTSYTQNLLIKYFQFPLRGRIIIEILLIFFILILFIYRKRFVNFRFLNNFLLIFCFTSLFTSLLNFKVDVKDKLNDNFIPIPKESNTIKPIILIISDEYASPNELYKINKDSSVFRFSQNLKKKGWNIKNNFYSYETSTIHSLSSLFNFNLSLKNDYRNEEVTKIGANKVLKASIADSLYKKKIEIINFGIFHLGKEIYLNRLYPYPVSFFEDIMINTVYYTVKTNIGNIDGKGLAKSSYPIEAHNKFILHNLIDTVNSKSISNQFVYAHIIMPHIPFQFNPLFPRRTQNNFFNYLAYWNFTNNLLEQLLGNLIKENKFRIILTGDHGYREDKRINPHYTFTAFYGFNQNSIERIKSVQDLGSLIYGSY